MAGVSTRTLGCSGCLIQAIERADENALRKLLSAETTFDDTYWIPRSEIREFKYPFSGCGARFPVFSDRTSNSAIQCQHELHEGSLVPAMPTHIAMSVVATAMLYTTESFNALQIVVESQKFDMTEPFVFHWSENDSFGLWQVLAVDATGFALLIFGGLLLLTTLKRNSLLNFRGLRAMEIISNEDYWENRDWACIRASDPFAFLSSNLYFFEIMFQNRSTKFERFRRLILITALSKMGMSLSPDTLPTSFERSGKQESLGCISENSESTLLSSLDAILLIVDFLESPEAETLSILSVCIRSGWICDQSGETILCRLVAHLHFRDVRRVALRIARQLLALGLCRKPVLAPAAEGEPALPWPRNCFFEEAHSEVCARCRVPHTAEDCPLVVPLAEEFFRKPLSLLQLSRIAIRSSLGMNQFERRVQTLPLPPLLLGYVWRANEMLLGPDSNEMLADAYYNEMFVYNDANEMLVDADDDEMLVDADDDEMVIDADPDADVGDDVDAIADAYVDADADADGL